MRKFKISSLLLFLLLGFSLSSLAQANPRNCQILLIPPQYVLDKVQTRTQSFQTQPESLIYLLNKQNASHVLLNSRDAVIGVLASLNKLYVTAYREDLLLKKNKDKDQVLSEANRVQDPWVRDRLKTLLENRSDIWGHHFSFNSGEISPEYEKMLLPFRRNPALAEALLKDLKNKITPMELDRLMSQKEIQEIHEKTKQQIVECAEHEINGTKKLIEGNAFRPDLRFTVVIEACRPLLSQFLRTLLEKLPLTTDSVRESLRSTSHQLIESTPEFLQTQRLESGKTQLTLTNPPIQVRYNPVLGTAELSHAKGVLTHAENPLVILDHGVGASTSNATSWQSVITNFIHYGYNPVATDLPMAGSGMTDIAGFHEMVSYLNLRNRELAKNYGGPVTLPHGSAERPVRNITRSATFQTGDALARIHHDREDDPVDFYVFTSPSNPLNMKEDLENLLELVRQGKRKIVPEALDHFTRYTAEYLQWLKEHMTEFQDYGERTLLIQGMGDEEGGPNAYKKLMGLSLELAPRAHIYPIESPLAWKDEYKHIDLNLFPGGHHLFSNRPNTSRREMEQYFQGVPEGDIPRLQDQFQEIVWLMDLFQDYLIESPSPLKDMEQSRKKLHAYRLARFGVNEHGVEITWKMHHQKKAGFSEDALLNAKPGYATPLNRFKKVVVFLKNERERIWGSR